MLRRSVLSPMRGPTARASWQARWRCPVADASTGLQAVSVTVVKSQQFRRGV